MPTHSSVAKSVREDKQRSPWKYCPDCLWMTGDGRSCPRHGGPPWRDDWAELARRISREEITVREARALEMGLTREETDHAFSTSTP